MPHDQNRAIPGVAITGTIGVGKTVLAEALSEIMESKGLRHALIDVDWLGQVYPPPDPTNPHSHDLAFANLSTIAPTFIQAGSRYFVVAVTLVSQEEVERLKGALPRVSMSVCLVEASPETIANRIRRRELGSLRDDFLARTDALAGQIVAAGNQDFVVSNENEPITEVAEQLLERLNWK